MVKLVPAVCPNCGADIRLPDDRDRGFCTFCGGQVLLSKEVTNVHIGGGSVDNYLELGDRSFRAGDYERAIECLEEAQEITLENEEVNGLLNRAYLARSRELLAMAEAKENMAQQVEFNSYTGLNLPINSGLDHHDRHNYHRLRQNQRLFVASEAAGLRSEALELRERAKVYMRKAGVCPECNGYRYCPSCRGTGGCSACGADGTKMLFFTCKACAGSGICPVCRGNRSCPYCRATGRFGRSRP